MQYDALGRRTVCEVTNSADLDATYHYYYDGHSLVEVRNGSDMVLKQHVWGLEYVDELIEVAINDDPTDGTEDDVETFYYALHDANFNVIGLTDDSGDLVERYEYTPYGQRTVYFNPGTTPANDLTCHAPTLISRRVEIAGSKQPYGLNNIGHQGLPHDEFLPVAGGTLVYNRARTLHPGVGRFLQRDPLGYVDGMNLFQMLRSNSNKYFDPTGTQDHSGTNRQRSPNYANDLAQGVGRGVVNFGYNAATGLWGAITDPFGTAYSIKQIPENLIEDAIEVGSRGIEVGSAIYNDPNIPGQIVSDSIQWVFENPGDLGEALGEFGAGIISTLLFKKGCDKLFKRPVRTTQPQGPLPQANRNNPNHTTILGNGQNTRVVPFAERTGARTLDNGLTEAQWNALSPKQRYKINDGELRKHINAGDSFRDVGPDGRERALDLRKPELLRLQERGVPVEPVSAEELRRILGE